LSSEASLPRQSLPHHWGPHHWGADLKQFNLTCMPICKEEFLQQVFLVSCRSWRWTSGQMRAFNKLWGYLEQIQPQIQDQPACCMVAAAEPVLLQELRPKPVLVSFGTWL